MSGNRKSVEHGGRASELHGTQSETPEEVGHPTLLCPTLLVLWLEEVKHNLREGHLSLIETLPRTTTHTDTMVVLVQFRLLDREQMSLWQISPAGHDSCDTALPSATPTHVSTRPYRCFCLVGGLCDQSCTSAEPFDDVSRICYRSILHQVLNAHFSPIPTSFKSRHSRSSLTSNFLP